MTRRTAIKIIGLAGDNLASVNWPRETYCPPWFLIERAALRLLDDPFYGGAASAFAGASRDPVVYGRVAGEWLDGVTNEEGAWL